MVRAPGRLTRTDNFIFWRSGSSFRLFRLMRPHDIRSSSGTSGVKRRMPVENGLMTQPRRGRAITVRTPGRAPFIEAASNPLLDDVAAEPAEDDLLELEGADEEEENEETPP